MKFIFTSIDRDESELIKTLMVVKPFSEDQHYLLGIYPQDEDLESYAIFIDSESGNTYSLITAA